jgi:UDP-N-acetylmuramoyl-tripeptide--D-alanyl-D-alanine ligase
MRPRTLPGIAAAVGGTLRGGDAGANAVVRGVTTDSRKVAPGDLFVALAGERSDGHSFVSSALAAGAAAVLVSRGHRVAEGGPLIEVADPGAALLDLARDERSSLRALVVGITGSTGKTCTKDFVAAVLGRRLRVVASPASFNTEVGLPLTILSASEDTEALVCEMGARGPGHIRLLCEVARPHVGVVTNVGVAHMELFGSPDVLRDAKAELPEALPPEGAAILNADDPVVRSYATRTRAQVVTYGVADAEAQVRATDLSMDRATGRAAFRIVTPAGSVAVSLPVPGQHMVPDALAAAAVGWFAGLAPEEIGRGLAGAEISAGRMEVFETPDGVRVVDDSYNANPVSMAAGLKAARWMAGDGRCIAVLGHMAELGPISAEEHERAGGLVARLGIQELITVGDDARLIAVGAEREGVEPERIHRSADADEALTWLRRLARPGDLVLIKASRIERLERVAAALRAGALGSGAMPAGSAGTAGAAA